MAEDKQILRIYIIPDQRADSHMYHQFSYQNTLSSGSPKVSILNC